MSEVSISLTTIIIDFRRCPSRKIGLRPLLQTIILPYTTKRKALKDEYKIYVKKGYLDSTKHKLRFFIDHFILWIGYAIKAWYIGYVEGATWKVK